MDNSSVKYVPRDEIPQYEEKGYAICGCCVEKRGVPMALSPEFDGAKWITHPDVLHAFAVRRRFCADRKIARALIRVTALGFGEFFLNGERLTDDLLLPALSNYEKRDLSGASFPIFDTMTQRIYYLEFDITGKLQDGENEFTCHVGNGWYGRENITHAENMPVWGKNKVIYKIFLTYEDGAAEILDSDGSEDATATYVRFTDIYVGEMIDATVAHEWVRCVTLPAQPTLFVKQDFPGDRIDKVITPVLIGNPGGGKLYSLGGSYAGRWVIKFNDTAKPGDAAYVTCADRIKPDGSFVQRHSGGDSRAVKDTFIFGGEDIEFCPVFTWHACTYILVQGDAELVRFETVYSPVRKTAEFRSENKVLQWIFDAYVLTQNDNIHSMVPSDCPHRERLGYTGDGQLAAGACMTVFDSESMYRKWMDDVADCQDIFNGHVQHTAPFLGGGGGPGGWGGAICIVPWRFYRQFGDRSVLEKYYDRMKLYLKYMEEHSESGIVVREEEGGWCLGDWCPPDNDIKITPEFVNTYFNLKCIDIVIKTAGILGNSKDSDYYKARYEYIRNAFVDNYFDVSTGSFAGGVQGADAFALDLGLGDRRTELNLVAKYSRLMTFDTGIFGTDILIRVLFERGYSALAAALLTNNGEISFANMMRHGSKTLWENWDGCDSMNHPMFGAVCEYIFTEMLGIKQRPGTVGFEKVEIKPAYLPEIGDISGSIMTPKGRISVAVSYDENGRMHVNSSKF